MVTGILRSQALYQMILTTAADSRAANESELRKALNSTRIAASLLEADQKTERHNADMAGKLREQDRRDEELVWKRNASVEASARGTALNSARIGEIRLRGQKMQFEALLALFQDHRKRVEHTANVDLTQARTRTTKTEKEIKIADFKERQTARKTERKHTRKKNKAERDLLQGRNNREEAKNILELTLIQRRIDHLDRVAGLQETIAHDQNARKADFAATGAFAAAESTADQGQKEHERAQRFKERLAADAEVDPNTFAAQAQTGGPTEAPIPEVAETVAVIAEEVIIRGALHDLDTEQTPGEPGPDDGPGIGETIESAIPSPEAAAGIDVTASTGPDLGAPNIGPGADTGPGAMT